MVVNLTMRCILETCVVTLGREGTNTNIATTSRQFEQSGATVAILIINLFTG